MASSTYNSVDPQSGSKTYSGPSEITKGNHNNMPARTDAYLATDERGHIQASSLGGTNHQDNIAPQAKDLNHGSYYNMENAERAAIRDGSTIHSEKTAFSSNQPGNRPDAFMVNDTITFPDGQTQEVHLSFSNMQNDQQAAINEEAMQQASDLMDEFDNPGDTLRDSMTAEEYAELMEETDAALPNIADYYSEWDYEGAPGTNTESTGDWVGSDTTADTVSDSVSSESDGSSAESDGADTDGSDGGAGPSADDD